MSGAVETAAWNRLVDLYERQTRYLLSHGVSIETQATAFQEALSRVAQRMATGAAETPPAYRGPAPLELIQGGKRAGEIEGKHRKRAQHLTRRRPQIVKRTQK